MTAILRNRLRIGLVVACCAALVGVAAGCGDSSSSASNGVPKDAIAVVNKQPIAKAQLDAAVEQYNRGAVAAKQPAIKCCDTAYWNVVQQKIVPYLVQRTEFEQQAKKIGVVVTPAAIDKQLDSVIKQYFGGKKSKLIAAIKKQGSSMAEVRDTIYINLLQSDVTKKLTAGVKVSDKEALDYYNKNKANYSKPTSRDLAHILVKKKAKAQSIYNQLVAGASFATLAKKFSTDKGSAINGGKLGVQAENALVKPFSTVAFKLKTGTISKPVHTQFGWHVIKALGPVIPASTSPFSKEKAGIKTSLLQAKDSEKTSTFQSKMQAFYAHRVKYANKYALPSATSPAATSLAPTVPAGG